MVELAGEDAVAAAVAGEEDDLAPGELEAVAPAGLFGFAGSAREAYALPKRLVAH